MLAYLEIKVTVISYLLHIFKKNIRYCKENKVGILVDGKYHTIVDVNVESQLF